MPDILKIDVEGAEGLVLNGARHILRTRRPLVFLSLHPWLTPSFGQTAQEVRNILENLGYSLELLSVDHEEHWRAIPLKAQEANPA